MKQDISDFQVAHLPKFSGALAALMVLLCFGTLSAMPGLSGAFGTYVIGIVSLGIIYWAIKTKYGGAIQLNAEVVFLVGVCLQYLAAPILLRFVSGDFEFFRDQGITSERWEVKEGYCGGMLIVVGFVACFFIGTSFFSVKRLPRDAANTLLQTPSGNSIWLIGALAALLWVARLFLLKTGSYYHLNRSDFQFEDWRYSIFAQIDTTLGMIVLGYIFTRYLASRKAWFWPFAVYLVLDFLWNFASGSRERALTVLIVLLVAYVIVKNQFPKKVIFPLIVGGLFLVGFMDYYRYASMESTDVNSIELAGIQSALSSAKSQNEAKGWGSTAMGGLARLNDLESVAAIYHWVPSSIEHLNGETYLSIVSGIIPRFLWKDKPPVILPLNKWIFVNEGGTSPTTIMGEGYLNYGWAGVFAAGIFCGLCVGFTEKLFCARLASPLFIAFYIWFVIGLARLHTQPAGIWVSMVFKNVLFFYVADYLARLAAPALTQGRQSREPLPGLEPAHDNGPVVSHT